MTNTIANSVTEPYQESTIQHNSPIFHLPSSIFYLPPPEWHALCGHSAEALRVSSPPPPGLQSVRSMRTICPPLTYTAHRPPACSSQPPLGRFQANRTPHPARFRTQPPTPDDF